MDKKRYVGPAIIIAIFILPLLWITLNPQPKAILFALSIAPFTYGKIEGVGHPILNSKKAYQYVTLGLAVVFGWPLFYAGLYALASVGSFIDISDTVVTIGYFTVVVMVILIEFTRFGIINRFGKYHDNYHEGIQMLKSKKKN